MEESPEDFSKLLSSSQKAEAAPLSPGDRVRATIVTLGQEDAYVALGPGQEGVVAAAELRDAEGRPTRRAGDVLDLFVTAIHRGEIRLSTNPTDKNLAEDLKEAFEQRRPIEGRVVEACKGGLRVSVKGKTAFCPISQIDTKRTETGAEFIGKTLVFRITEFKEEGRDVVVSRRKVLEEELGRTTDAFLAANPAGAVVPGKVVRLEKFGAFVELVPGVEGLVHVSELAWSRVESPAEILKVGQTVAVKILKKETVEGRLKISLSLKQATEKPTKAAPADPWAKYSAGQVLEGKVTRKEPYGLFIQLEPGIIGLLHQSKTEDRPDFQLERSKVGDSISIQIAEIKLGERRISLELPRDVEAEEWQSKQASEAPAGSLAEKLKAALEKKR